MPEAVREASGQDTKAPKEAPKPKDRWDKAQAIAPIITGIIVAVLGYALTGAVSNAFRRQELQLSNAKEMRDVIKDLQSRNTDDEAAMADALTLSAFGAPAAGPLVTVLATGDGLRRKAAERGLRALGLTAPDAVCAPLLKIVDDRRGRFDWLTLLSAIRLTGDVGCSDALGALGRCRAIIATVDSPQNVAPLAAMVSATPAPDYGAAEQLLAALDRSMKVLAEERR